MFLKAPYLKRDQMNSYQNKPSPFETITGPNPLEPATSKSGSPTRQAGKTSGSHFAPKSADDNGSEKPVPRKRKGVKIAAAICGLSLVAVYGAGAYLFSQRYYPGTSVAGVDISLMDQASAMSHIENAARTYSLTISGHDFSWTFSPNDGSTLIDAEGRAKELLDESEPLIWPVRLLANLTGEDPSADAADLPDSFDKSAFTSQLMAAVEEYNQGRSGVFDAASAYDADKAEFTVEQAKKNVKIKFESIEEDALSAVASFQTELELDARDFEEFATGATDNQLSLACAQANELLGANLSLTMGGSEIASVDGELLAGFIRFDESLTPAVDTAKLEEWSRTLATTLDTVGVKRTYTRPDGKTVEIDGGTYGWSVDVEQLVSLVKDAVTNKTEGDLEIPCTSTGAVFTMQGEKDWAEYVDIDLTEQHARYYDASGALKWESGCITGNPNKGNATPTGVYRMNRCGTNITLRGAIDPETGEREYETPVKYWMPFIGGAVGLHDADWQSSASFSNPSAYTYVGSHGCVNLPPDKAGELYNLVKQGICVIVHW